MMRNQCSLGMLMGIIHRSAAKAAGGVSHVVQVSVQCWNMSESGIHVHWLSRICWPWPMLNADAMLLM
eukprot:3923662-Rhodomonas_salina.1